MGWVVRLFDRRDTWVRLVLLDLSGVSYLLFGMDGRRPTSAQLWLAVTAFVALLAFCRRPVLNFLVQVALLGVAICVLHDTTINQVGSSWALAEVALWARRPRTIWLCAAVLLAVYLGLAIPVEGDSLRSELFGVIVLPVGLPLLLGLVVRTTRELGVQAELRAASESRAARADERGAIARELHDVVAHHVASMVLRVGVARHVIPGIDPRVAEVLDDVHGTGTTALADLRRLVEVLRGAGGLDSEAAITAIEPGSLPAALGAAVDTARRTGLTVEADIDEAVGGLDAVRGLAVLRLTQEALTNVAKHAGPTAKACLRISVENGAVSWEVADEGGAPVRSAPGGGHGLIGMRERVEVLGGKLTAGPAGNGWRVRTVLPRVAA